MQVDTQRLRIRQPTLQDVDGLVRLIPPSNIPYTREDAELLVRLSQEQAQTDPRNEYIFGIELLADQQFVGMASLSGIIGQKPGVAYWIDKEHQGQGIMSEALPAIVDYVFSGAG